MNRLDPAAPRQAINLSLSTDVVSAARNLTSDLSETVKMLLAKYVQDARRGMDDVGLDEVMAALNRFHAEHGFLSDEFSNL